MSHLYIFDGTDDEALTTYEEGEVATDWRAHLERSGGAIYEIADCVFCQHPVSHYEGRRTLPESEPERHRLPDFEPHSMTDLVVCRTCGWYRTQSHFFLTSPIFPLVAASTAQLKQRYISDTDLPLNELRSHLMRNWGDRRLIQPSQAEALVADVFKNYLDGEIKYTSNGVYVPDGGIDFVIAQSQSGIEYAFQVKRRMTDRPECVEKVRAFVGAVAASKYKHGYYVTTSPVFTSAAVRELEKSGSAWQITT